MEWSMPLFSTCECDNATPKKKKKKPARNLIYLVLHKHDFFTLIYAKLIDFATKTEL